MKNALKKAIYIGLTALLTMSGCQEDAPVDLDDPGRVTLHRLNKAEYNNTVRDLLGTSLTPANDFPGDDHGHGFDNIADALTMSPLHVELYHRAAELLTDDLLRLADTSLAQFEDLESTTGARYRNNAWSLWESTALPIEFETPADGSYRLSIRAGGIAQSGEMPKLRVSNNGVELQTIDIDASADALSIYEVDFEGTEGPALITVELLNPYTGGSSLDFRRAILDWVKLEGPLNQRQAHPLRDEFIPCSMTFEVYKDCAQLALENLATRAWRRPVESTEVTRLLTLVDQAVSEGDGPEVGINLALQAILISPQFLFRVELDEDPESTTPHSLTDYELATRLSYFLWSSMPDDELMNLAKSNSLNNEETLKSQAQRMLASPKAVALSQNFAGQWLYTRAMPTVEPEPNTFPTFDDDLAYALQRETELYFNEFIASNRPVDQLLNAQFTYLNQHSAEHYGLSAIEDDSFQRVDTTGTERGGLLTHGSMLTVTSYPARTSPVQRGKWILKQLLCNEPEPPPPGVEGIDEEADAEASLRERLEAHRSMPVCASCHNVMDPMGFSLEHFDAIGGWRELDGEFEIDASGDFPDGRSFDGHTEMAQLISEDPMLKSCIAERLFIYALGKGVQESDHVHLERIVSGYTTAGSGFQELITEIITSPAFTMRRGESPEDVSSEEQAQ